MVFDKELADDEDSGEPETWCTIATSSKGSGLGEPVMDFVPRLRGWETAIAVAIATANRIGKLGL
jgi:hypothetical protein